MPDGESRAWTRAWRWAREVVVDRGEDDPVEIGLERAAGGYAFRLGVRAGFGGSETARIPVRVHPNAAPHPVLKEIHECEVAGQRLEAANPFALRAKVARLLETLAPARTLPVCYFRVPAMDYELPVYEDAGRFSCPIIGGPKLRARTLAGMRRAVCEHLLATGYVADEEQVEVGVVRPRDLSRVAPAAIFRSLADPRLWLPCVEGSSAEGQVIGLLERGPELFRPQRRRAAAGPPAREAGIAAAEVCTLLRVVRSELVRSRGADAGAAAYASEVPPEIWAATEERTEVTGTTLVAYLSDDEGSTLELAVRRTAADDLCTALEDRAGIDVFLAPDTSALAELVGAYLAAEGFLRFASEVEVHAARAPRAERLATESIWTHDDGFAVKEEVEAPWSSR